jgi:hypothetical protein
MDFFFEDEKYDELWWFWLTNRTDVMNAIIRTDDGQFIGFLRPLSYSHYMSTYLDEIISQSEIYV